MSDKFLLLTDDREALVELLESRAVMEDGALEALGVDPAKIPAVDLEVFAALAEDWKALRQQAEETATIPFFLPGYRGVMARAAALSTIEDLPADMRRFVDTMLAEHEGHLAREREVSGLIERIEENCRRCPAASPRGGSAGCRTRSRTSPACSIRTIPFAAPGARKAPGWRPRPGTCWVPKTSSRRTWKPSRA